MHLLLFLFRMSRRVVVLAIVAGIVSGASSAGLIAVITTTLSRAELSPTVLIAEFAGLALLMLISNILSRLLLLYLAQTAIYDLRMRLSRQILATPLRALEQLGAHRLLAALTDDVFAITDALQALPLVCIAAATVGLCLLYLGWLSWKVLLAALIVMALGMLSYQLLLRRSGRFFALAREDEDRLFQHFHALTEGIKELQLHLRRRDAFLDYALQPVALVYRRHTMLATALFTVASGWGELLFFIFIGLLLFALPALLGIAPAVMVGTILAVLYMMTPLATIMNMLAVFGRGSVALKQHQKLGLALAAPARSPAPIDPAPLWSRIDLVGLTHAYYREQEERSFTLGPLDLTFRPGELVFLVGGNGSGKTTLVKLLTGLYLPERGEIRVDQRPVVDPASAVYRQHFSVVFADFFVFDELLGIESAALDAQARAYLAQLQLDHKVQIRDGILSTTALSQGQRKRLALLTAYLEDRPFYVFDEWAADQDPSFKELFYTLLLPSLKAKGKAVLVITHDDKYFHLADRLIKMVDGQIEDDRYTAPTAQLGASREVYL